MSWLQALGILAAGTAAGAVNAVVGSGTLITFPVLLAFGYPPILANVSNTIGLVPGSASGAWAYRRELAGQERRAVRLGAFSFAGAIVGAVVLLTLPGSAFKAIVPVFIGIALVLIVFQPRLVAALQRRRSVQGGQRGDGSSGAVRGGVLVTGIYGGYFGAAQGILLLALFGLTLDQDIQRDNALKNVLAGLTNCVSGIVFMIAAHVAWGAVGLIAVGAIGGAQLGARYGRRLPPAALRGVIVAVGLFAMVRLLA